MEQDKIYSWVNLAEKLPKWNNNVIMRYAHTQTPILSPERYHGEKHLVEWLEEQTDKIVISNERYELFWKIKTLLSLAPLMVMEKDGLIIVPESVSQFLFTAKDLLNQLKETEAKHRPSFEDMDDAVRQIS